jgi:hypothetical protein
MMGLSFWLMMDGDTSFEPPEKIIQPKVTKGVPLTNGYVQGYIEVPDLSAAFKRCLNRGYSDQQKVLLVEAQLYFSNSEFDSGEFLWSKVIKSNELGQSEELNMAMTKNGLVLSIFESQDGKRGQLKEKRSSNLDELKELVKGSSVSFNEYAQKFLKREVEMTLILSKGLMKTLIIKSPKKTVTCKP